MPEHARRPLDLSALQLYGALDKLGFNPASPDALLETLRQIDLGLPAEDELAATLIWMGRCKFLQKLRQSQHPRESLKSFRVPDFLAVFERDGRDIPVLIQVKSSYGPHLRWSPAYYDRQQRYAQLVGLPLLVAWQWRQFGAWSLFESRHLANGRRLHFGDALGETLMTELAGDFWVTFQPGVGVHFISDIIEHGETHEPAAVGPHGLLEPGPYVMKIREAYFTNGRGERMDHLDPPGLWPFLITSSELRHESEVNGLSARSSFVIAAEDNGMQIGQRLLPMLLEQASETNVNWRSVLSTEKFPVAFEELRKAADDGIRTGFVYINALIQPRTKPGFL